MKRLPAAWRRKQRAIVRAARGRKQQAAAELREFVHQLLRQHVEGRSADA
jgi:molybdenum-dependent DNA-binding transcriptional regulator ModE